MKTIGCLLIIERIKILKTNTRFTKQRTDRNIENKYAKMMGVLLGKELIKVLSVLISIEPIEILKTMRGWSLKKTYNYAHFRNIKIMLLLLYSFYERFKVNTLQDVRNSSRFLPFLFLQSSFYFNLSFPKELCLKNARKSLSWKVFCLLIVSFTVRWISSSLFFHLLGHFSASFSSKRPPFYSFSCFEKTPHFGVLYSQWN